MKQEAVYVRVPTPNYARDHLHFGFAAFF